MNLLQKEANLKCGPEDVILSGGPGYRFADCLSVQLIEQAEATDITDTDDDKDVGDVRDSTPDCTDLDSSTTVRRKASEGTGCCR